MNNGRMLRRRSVLPLLAAPVAALYAPAYAVEPAKNGVTVNDNQNTALDLFKNRIIMPTNIDYPTDLPESLLFIDDPADEMPDAQSTPVIADRTPPKPESVGTITYQSVIDQTLSLSANYLSFLTASLTAEKRAEVIVQDVYRAKGEPYSNPTFMEAAQKLAAAFVRSDRPNRRFYYVQSVLYTTVQYRFFTKVDAKAKVGFSGVGFGANGEVFASTTDYSVVPIVSVNYIEVDLPQSPKPLGVVKPPAMLRSLNRVNA